MNEVFGNVSLGSINGTMAGDVSLLTGQVGNALYLGSVTVQLDLGFHQLECLYIPDMCNQGVTFALWIKRDPSSSDGYLLNTGAFRDKSKGKEHMSYNCVYNHGGITNEYTLHCWYQNYQ